MHRHLFAACAAVLPLCLLSVSANAALSPDCWKADEQRAAEVHNFQTMLMVGALKCRDRVPASLDGYNAFMGAKRDLIVANQYVLMSHFIREYGDSSGIGAFRDYETRVGNKHSGSDNLARCEAIGAMGRMAAGASEADLRELARVVGEDSLTSTCPNLAKDEGLTPTVAASTGPAEPAAAVAAAVAVNDAAPAAAEVGPDVAAPAEVTSASGTQPKVVTVAEAPAPTAAQALQEAARALALAATALQSEAAAPAASVPAAATAPKTTELATAPN